MTKWVTVCKIDELSENEATSIDTTDGPIAIIKKDSKFYAIEDCCSHQGLPLADGWIDEEGITCPFHGAKFCYKTGQALCAPAMGDIKHYETQVESESLQVWID